MTRNKNIRILFIGNSHTYKHDLPAFVATMAKEEGYSCEVTMLAHGGWYLASHVKEPQTRFNIAFGHYDYVVLQEHSHPFDHVEDYFEAAGTLASMAQAVGTKVVIYGTWARKNDEEAQEYMNQVNRELASKIGAILAPVGERWWSYVHSWPDIDMYEEDGAHASAAGIEYAAKIIWTTIESDMSSASSFPEGKDV